MSSKASEISYFAARGIRAKTPEGLNKAMQLALESMSATLFGDAESELTASEQTVLKRMGMPLEPTPDADPVGDAAAEYAALIDSSLGTAEVGKRTGLGGSRVRQMVADRSLYSMLLDGRRYVPIFQFLDADGKKLVPNIGQVNKALDPEFHPLQIYEWYTSPNPDLFLNDDIDQTISPLEWLKRGNDPEPVVRLAEML